MTLLSIPLYQFIVTPCQQLDILNITSNGDSHMFEVIGGLIRFQKIIFERVKVIPLLEK